jgi:hypothetical protein
MLKGQNEVQKLWWLRRHGVELTRRKDKGLQDDTEYAPVNLTAEVLKTATYLLRINHCVERARNLRRKIQSLREQCMYVLI